ncbi:MAG: TetR/AcrR family transcriptional regulator [Coriobacteriales bacterium]|jgi:AcrR family transcriptional regulator|nr:TetR/AcrR family transcriptional regulator [Coriobacteriales bacterium]
MDEASGTKEQIFDSFVEMTSTLGYENVSMRDIAKKVGINSASIYYHFQDKRQILELAYDYYIAHRYDNRKSVEEMKSLIETANTFDIVRAFLYTHESEDQRQYYRMVLIIKIVYMRIFQDPIANKLFTDMNDENAEYVIEVLKHGIEVGRIDPDFDIEMFADVFIGGASIMGIRAFADPNYSVQQLEQENRILAQFAQLLASAMPNG